MENAVKTPDIEITRKLKDGSIRIYGHLYWKPFLVAVFIFNRSFIFRDGKFKVYKFKQ